MTASRRVSMSYFMPPGSLRPDLEQWLDSPFGISTLDLIREGKRFGTTRRRFAEPGEIIHFEDDLTPYVVTEVRKPDLSTPEGRAAWEEVEGWSLNYIDANPKLKAQVYSPNAVQTLFRRVDDDTPPAPTQLELDVDTFPAEAIEQGVRAALNNPDTEPVARAVLETVAAAPQSLAQAPSKQRMAGDNSRGLLTALAALGASAALGTGALIASQQPAPPAPINAPL